MQWAFVLKIASWCGYRCHFETCESEPKCKTITMIFKSLVELRENRTGRNSNDSDVWGGPGPASRSTSWWLGLGSSTGWKSLRLAAVECFSTGIMDVVLKHNCLGQWQVENASQDLKQLSSTGPEHTSRDAIRASNLTCISPAQCSVHMSVEDSVRGWWSAGSIPLKAASWFSLSNDVVHCK